MPAPCLLKRSLKVIALFIILLCGLAGLAIAYFWRSDLSVSQLKQWQLPNSEFIDVDELKVHVVRSPLCRDLTTKTAIKDNIRVNTPLPETIVLLHGTSASLHTWNGWADELSQDYCVIRMDLPGFGLTGPFTDPSTTYTPDHYVALVESVLNQAMAGKVTLVGNSLGGGIAWLTAFEHPERVERLILVDAMGYAYTPKHVPIGFTLAKHPILDPITEGVLPKALVQKSLQSVYVDDSKVTDKLVNRYYELTRREGNRTALTRRLREFDTSTQIEHIADINVPTLILWGAKDDLIPLENAYRFKQDIKGSQLVIFDNLGHVPQEENPKATVKVVKQFLQEESLVQ